MSSKQIGFCLLQEGDWVQVLFGNLPSNYCILGALVSSFEKTPLLD